MAIIPMVCGSSFKNKGVQFMLDAVCRYLPSPLDKEAIEGTNPDTGEVALRKPAVDAPFSALAFKIATDPYVGRLAFFRAYSGHLDAGSYVLNTRSNNKERISRIYQMHANKQNPIEYIEAGDIGAAVGFKDIKTGDTLCDEKYPIVLESMVFPDPVIGIAVEPKTKADVDKLGMALAKLAEEDPTFQVKTDQASGQTIISGMGELHLEYVPSVEKGFKEAMKNGPLAGFEMDAMKITLIDGSFHPVDSDSLSFELAAKLGYKEAARAAKAVLMEPIMKLEVITPEENMGDIVGDLNRRRGQVNDMSDRNGAKVVKAFVPLSEMFGYVTTLRTLSSGRATSTMEFSHYAEAPSNIADEVIKKAKGN